MGANATNRRPSGLESDDLDHDVDRVPARLRRGGPRAAQVRCSRSSRVAAA
ncbi:MAG: hypothetical protein QOD36_4462 [Mycobacterium sp.]|nr:hypothetical protein [Mycobacterium sp.]